MRRIIFTLTMLSLFLTSCQFMHYDDSESLGNQFYFVKDGQFSSIVKSTDKEYKGTGYEVIPPLVISYNSNKEYIIAKSKDENQSVKYWILDKAKHSREIPLNSLDSIQFYRMLSEKNIELKFKK